MGNSECKSEGPSLPQKQQKMDQNDNITTNEDDYCSNINFNEKNAKKEQIIKIRSLGVLRGSKQLQFGLWNSTNRQSPNQRNRSLCKNEQLLPKNCPEPHLEPIVFSIIDFSVSSQHSHTQQSHNRIETSSSNQDKLLSSTRQKENDSTSSQKVIFDYLLNFPPTPFHVDVHKEQFIKIKKTKIQNDYQLSQKLGQGSFGVVYRGIHKQTSQERAVKVLKRSLLINPKVKQQFLQEFSILKKVDHPNILKLYQIYETKASISLVSQFCRGNSLASYIKKKMVFSSETKKEILRQILLGVNYLHHMNIIHRDLKPDNIVFVHPLSEQTKPEEVDLRIIDFGLAIEQNKSVFKDWANIGTYNYMAPQAFQGIYSDKCDSWACGVIMYALLLGYNPYKGYQANEVKEKIKVYRPNIYDFKDLSFQAIDLILHLTKVNHIMRWNMTQALNSQYFLQNQQLSDKDDVLSRLSAYKDINGLVSVTESFISFKKINQAQIFKLGRYFHSINTKKNGTINLTQLQEYFNQTSKDEVERYFKQIDKNRSGSIDFGQFLVAMSNKKQLFIKENLQEVFDAIDINKNGSISIQQIKYFLHTLDKEGAQQLINEISESGNNFITFQEFSEYLLKKINYLNIF